jgi:hypothetical protein
MERDNGSDWQIKIFEKYGLGSVILSLWESFKKNKRFIKTTNMKIDLEYLKIFDLLYFIPYFPFFFIEKVRKYYQDIIPIKNPPENNDVFNF